MDPRGVQALSRNLVLENVIERFKGERSTAGEIEGIVQGLPARLIIKLCEFSYFKTVC